jgi:hypothetical protein
MSKKKAEDVDKAYAGGLPFSLACVGCEAGEMACAPPTPAAARADGWKAIDVDREGLSWNYIGWCPECWAVFTRPAA